MHDADVDLGLTCLPATRRNFFDAGFSSRNANCACANHGFSTELNLDLAYITVAAYVFHRFVYNNL